MIEKVQVVAKVLGHEGCNFFSDLKIVELALGLDLDPLKEARWAMDNGYLDLTSAYIPSAGAHLAIMKHASGRDWKSVVMDAHYVCEHGQWEKLQFGMVTFDHYVVGDGRGSVLWDSCGDLIARTPSAILKAKRIFWL